jgi:phage-related protein
VITLSQALKDWKAGDNQVSPIAVLYDISITDAITVRLVEGNPTGGTITYDGNVYTPAGIARGNVEQSIAGEIGSFEVQVSNIDGVPGGYIEQYELDGRRVTITTVPVSTLSPADAVVETYTIQGQAYTREVASITLGYSNLFRRRLPWRRYQRIRCLHDWERRFELGNGCGFPSDEFEADTTQLLVNGAVTDSEQKRRYGWYALNMTKASTADVNTAEFGSLYLETFSSDVTWSGANRNGPFLYKKLSGDFDCYTKVNVFGTRESGLLGMLCQEDGAPQDSWIFLARTRKTGEDISLTVRSSIDGSQETSVAATQPDPRYLRMKRVGDLFTLYYALVENTDWVELTQATVPMSTEIRIGAAIGGGEGQGLSASYPFFRFTSGGPSTCDRTKEGVDGCRVKDNVHRIFLFDGIPRR